MNFAQIDLTNLSEILRFEGDEDGCREILSILESLQVEDYEIAKIKLDDLSSYLLDGVSYKTTQFIKQKYYDL